MVYSHYWTQRRQFTRAEWTAFSRGCFNLFELCHTLRIPLAFEFDQPDQPPLINRDELRFNGVGRDGHESLQITRLRPSKSRAEKPRGWDYCQTDRKPYDLAVTAVLAYLDSICPDAFAASSDGDEEAWRAGALLASKAWPEATIELPRAIRDQARFAKFEDSSKHHQLVWGHDGKLYLERHADRWVILLPLDHDDLNVWEQALPKSQRKWGPFVTDADREACAARRLEALWKAYGAQAKPPGGLPPLPKSDGDRV